MHDLEFNHLHYIPDDEVNEVAWATDNVELTTVGIDIGSSTSHLMFSLVHLQRLGTALSSRFVVIKRQIMWQSPIKLTPYLPDYTIDTDDLAEFFGGCYHLAQVDPDDVDSGAVILTGEAIKRHNARAIAELFSEESGTFVCASAGHHMECQMAAHGSGAVAMSRGQQQHRAQCRYRRRHHQARLDREGRDPRHDRDRGRRPPDRRRQDPRHDADRGAGPGGCAEPRHCACARRAADGTGSRAHRRADGAPGHAHDRPAAAGRAGATAAGDRPLAAANSPTRHWTRSRFPAGSPSTSTSASSAISATSAPTSRRACGTCWPGARTCRRSGTRARASAPP